MSTYLVSNRHLFHDALHHRVLVGVIRIVLPVISQPRTSAPRVSTSARTGGKRERKKERENERNNERGRRGKKSKRRIKKTGKKE